MERNTLVFSDVHGDRDAMIKLREAAKRFSSGRMISAGDLCPDPYDSVFFSIEGARGNCDRFYEYGSLPFPPLQYRTELYGKRILVVHGHLPFEIPDDIDVLITGHTHVPLLEKRGSLYLLNPGSASLPRSSEGATFALISPSGLTLLSLLDFSEIRSLSFSES